MPAGEAVPAAVSAAVPAAGSRWPELRWIVERLERRRPPLFLAAVWLTGMGLAIDVLENKALFMRRYPSADWPHLWLIVAGIGLAAGILLYWLGGAWFHLRVRLSGGRGGARLSRRLALYAGVPAAAVSVVWMLLHTVAYGAGYFTRPKLPHLEAAALAAAVLAVAASLWLSYRGARAVMGAAPVRAALLFLALPVYLHLIVIGITTATGVVREIEARQLIERAHQQNGEEDFYGAEKTLRQALTNLTPDEAAERLEAGNLLGLVCERRGDATAAIAGYRIALTAAEPGSADSFACLGNIRIQEQKVPEAVRLFEAALRCDPEHDAAHNNLGLIYMGDIAGGPVDLERALRHNRKARGLHPDPPLTINLARNLFLLERWREAIPLYQSLHDADPDDADHRYLLGICLFMDGRDSHALKLLTAADFNRRGITLYEEGDYAESERFLRRALALLPPEASGDRITYLTNLAVVLGEADNPAGQAASYRDALALTPDGSAQRFQLQGSLLLAEGKIRQAILAFDHCLTIDPDNLRAHKNLGQIFLGDLDERTVDYPLALAHNERAYSLQKNTATRWNLARNYYVLDRDLEALELFEQILAGSPDDPDALYYMGMVRYGLGDLNRAQECLRRAITLDPSLKDEDVEEILNQTLGDADRKKV